jgi:hypothetical protein
MSGAHEFTVTIGTSDDVQEKDVAAELLQWVVSDAAQRHEHINYVTVQHSEMDDYEVNRLLKLLDRYDTDDIESAIDSLDALEEG